MPEHQEIPLEELNVGRRLLWSLIISATVVAFTVVPYMALSMRYTPVELRAYITSILWLSLLGFIGFYVAIKRLVRPLDTLFEVERREEKPSREALLEARVAALNMPIRFTMTTAFLFVLLQIPGGLWMWLVGRMNTARVAEMLIKTDVALAVCLIFLFFVSERILFPVRRYVALRTAAVAHLAERRMIRTGIRLRVLAVTMMLVVVSLFIQGSLSYQWATQVGLTREQLAGLLRLELVVGFLSITGAAVAAYLFADSIARPLKHLSEIMHRVEEGEHDLRVDVLTNDEIGDLGTRFNRMIARLEEAHQESEAWRRELEARVAERTEELTRLVETQGQLLETIRKMSVPVVPVLRGIIVMSLVGPIDQERAQRIVDGLLEGVERHQAKIVLLDITGVPEVDREVAAYLVQAAQAARLVGAEAVLVGIRPEIADTLVELDVDLTGLVTRSDLEGGITYALQRLNRQLL